MSRFTVIAFMLITFSLGLNFFNEINRCYCGPYCGQCLLANPKVGYQSDYTGHRIVDMEIAPMFDTSKMIKDSNGNNIDISVKNSSGEVTGINETLMKSVLENMSAYTSPAPALTDWLGFFGYVLPAMRFMVNTMMLPVFGLPSFMVEYLYVPSILAYFIGLLLFIAMMLGIVEFITGRVF
jgi:hypothetical protein